MRIIGMKKEIYIGKVVSGHNMDFEYSDEELTRHILFAVLDDNTKVKITLESEEGECSSGWTTASFGHCNVEVVEKFEGYTHKALKQLVVKDISVGNADDFYCDVFNVSFNGGDDYYPSGYYNVDETLFKEGLRHKEKRPVWIITGNSALGKSYLSSRLEGMTVFETDMLENSCIYREITEDVVVIGNRHDIKVEEVVDNLFGDTEIIEVSFKRYNRKED